MKKKVIAVLACMMMLTTGTLTVSASQSSTSSNTVTEEKVTVTVAPTVTVESEDAVEGETYTVSVEALNTSEASSSEADNEEVTVQVTDANGNTTAQPMTKKEAVQAQKDNVKELVRQAAAPSGQTYNHFTTAEFDVKPTGDMQKLLERNENTPITLTFTVDGVKPGDKIVLSHLTHSGQWETRDSADSSQMTVGNNTVTVTLTGLSPVVIVKAEVRQSTLPSPGTDNSNSGSDDNDSDSDDDTPVVVRQVLADIITGPTSPKTAEAAPFVAVAAVAALAGAVVFTRKTADK